MSINLVIRRFFQPALILVGVYIVPIVLMQTEIISPDFKYHILIGMSLVLLVYAISTGIRFQDLGLTRQNLKPSLRRVMPLSILVAMIILGLYFLQWFRSDSSPAHWTFYIFYIFVSAFLQEFIYRGFLFHLLARAKVSRRWIILVSSTLYGFMHIIFDIPSVVFTFMIGLFWSWAYAKDRNLYSVSASHAVLGALSLLANFS